ncbi:MAG: NGG1p interacting factor NIF3 [archaeon]
MKLKELYETAVEKAIEADPRGKKEVIELLKERKKEFKELKAIDQEFYDKDRLWNPYDDSRILNGKPESNVKTALIGIDVEVSEVLLAHTLNKDKKAGIDLLLAHHPEGNALYNLFKVTPMQARIMELAGMPISAAENFTSESAEVVSRRFSAVNAFRTVDASKLLGFPLICLHTVADNYCQQFVKNLVEKNNPRTLNETIELLKEVPEFIEYRKRGQEIKLVNGNPNNSLGNFFVEMTGGTTPVQKVYKKLANSGVSTIIDMHNTEDNIKEAKKHNLNIILTNHIPSDNLGLNLLLDQIEKKLGKLNVIECSGFVRVKRK